MRFFLLAFPLQILLARCGDLLVPDRVGAQGVRAFARAALLLLGGPVRGGGGSAHDLPVPPGAGGRCAARAVLPSPAAHAMFTQLKAGSAVGKDV